MSKAAVIPMSGGLSDLCIDPYITGYKQGQIDYKRDAKYKKVNAQM